MCPEASDLLETTCRLVLLLSVCWLLLDPLLCREGTGKGWVTCWKREAIVGTEEALTCAQYVLLTITSYEVDP